MLDQEGNCYGFIDLKSEIEVKEEPFDIVEEEAAYNELERDCIGSIDMKSEIEVKEEPFDFEERKRQKMMNFWTKFVNWIKI
ncbi:hypothetical protein Avbf_17521, partial [Armadillidium vulgare]